MTADPAQPIDTLLAALDAGRTTARALADAALAAIAAAGETERPAFTAVHTDTAPLEADAQDLLRRAGRRGPLSGIPVSVKDLFDEAGRVTTAGSRVPAGEPPAARDAAAVARLRAAGAVVVGRTAMTEFAFSGLGLNPHTGTPGNPADPARIPGGSSSGAAVSVAAGMVPLALGTDTGGSVRIPAALCGLVGFKPTQARVPRDGTVPLSPTLDTVGPLARTVACCTLADAVLAGEAAEGMPAPVALTGLRLAVPRTLVLDDLEPAVAAAFDAACRRLSRAGAQVSEVTLAELGEIPVVNAAGGFPAAEAYARHRRRLDATGDRYDPRVRGRILRGAGLSAADYIDLLHARADLMRRVDAVARAYDALLLPTVPCVAPRFADIADDDAFTRLNTLVLRNPSLANFLDRCAITLPMQAPGDLPCGLSLMGAAGDDRRLLAMAAAAEPVVRPR
ncbi:amidase [Azospirillum halopraeferens]|uniref:amidase n=1 Tax=Azospirillum halopraeferens TaxID=34010 RepID=UPI00042A546F|nr:amidase [Azospirillum halopraeferens]